MQKEIQLGKSDITVSTIGVGTMAWSNSSRWGYGAKLGQLDVLDAYRSSLANGPVLLDTAEIYGFGQSERILGKLLKNQKRNAVTASKYAPLPWRLSGQAVNRAVAGSLRRLGTGPIDLYQIHFPGGWISIPTLMNRLADAVERGQIRYVGVSNFDAQQMRLAHDVLAERGIPLASNQVEYSLVHRTPEFNGVLEKCQELGITLIAYSPLGRGVLSGSYSPGHSAPDVRRFYGHFKDKRLGEMAPLITALREIGEAHDGKSAAQAALNWLARQANVLPIPGAKNEKQARDNMAAIGWYMSDEEVQRLDALSWSLVK